MLFADLNLSEPILRALIAEGYKIATPIQAQAIPHVLAGRDVMGCAQTGTGKTAAFALPILNAIVEKKQSAQSGRPLVLVLCPTRELATQIADGFRAYGANVRARTTVIFGGVGQRPQADAVRRGVEVCIATPGRLLDLMNQRLVDLRDVHTLVLDEADRMLDMGFIHDIKRITQTLSKNRQTLMFSATMPREIRELAKNLLRDPVSVQVASVSSTADNIDQSVYFVDKKNKAQLLAHLYHELPMARSIVFTRTKHGADKVVAQLYKRGIRAEAIHGNKSQNARQRALSNFKAMKTPILVATDIASRGIDVDGITHVVNYDLTHEPETYVHRIGRTARAGASGNAVSFCDHDERQNLRQIERLIKRSLTVREDHPVYDAASPALKGLVGDVGRPSSDDRESSSHRKHSEPRRHESHRNDSHPPRHDRHSAGKPSRGGASHGGSSFGSGSHGPTKSGGVKSAKPKHYSASKPRPVPAGEAAGRAPQAFNGAARAGGKPKVRGKARTKRRF